MSGVLTWTTQWLRWRIVQNNETRKEMKTAIQEAISDVMSSFLTKLKSRLKELENEKTWDEWDDGVNFGRKDMIDEVFKMVEELSKNHLRQHNDKI